MTPGRGLGRLHRLHRRLGPDQQAGTTLIEVVVAMTIMTICGAIFTGAMVTLFRANNAAQAVSNSSQQVNQAYQSLDKTVRYAGAISTPGVSTTSPGGGAASGDWYVELSTTSTGTEVCTQLRVDLATGTLQQRTWSTASSPVTPSAWRALASNLVNGTAAAGSADQPFVLRTASATAQRQQLTFTLVARTGPASDARTSRSSFTLAALNSSVPQTSSSICQQTGRP